MGELSIEKIKELKAESNILEPVVWIGKAGITETVVKEAKKQLKARDLIKVKFLKAAMEEKGKRELAQEIAEKTGSQLVHQVGFIAVLYRQKEGQQKVFK